MSGGAEGSAEELGGAGESPLCQVPQQEEGIFQHSLHESGLTPDSSLKQLPVCLEKDTGLAAGPV